MIGLGVFVEVMFVMRLFMVASVGIVGSECAIEQDARWKRSSHWDCMGASGFGRLIYRVSLRVRVTSVA